MPLDRSCAEGSAELAIISYSVAPGISGTRVDLQEFRQSLGRAAPPRGIQPPLKALWHDAKDEWDQAHNIVQQEDDAASAWVHAYLHRKEGDDSNAGYWYRRGNGPLPAERLRKNGKASRWRCSASINRSLKRPQAQKRWQTRSVTQLRS